METTPGRHHSDKGVAEVEPQRSLVGWLVVEPKRPPGFFSMGHSNWVIASELLPNRLRRLSLNPMLFENQRFGGGALLMGPTCEVLLNIDDEPSLLAIDTILASASQQIERTRKGRERKLWMNGRPIYVSVSGPPPVVELGAGLNGPEDYALLRQLAEALASGLGGLASEPVK